MVCVMFRYRRACTVLVNHNADYPLYTYTALSTFDMHAAASQEEGSSYSGPNQPYELAPVCMYVCLSACLLVWQN